MIVAADRPQSSFRFLCPQGCGGSSPPFRTNIFLTFPVVAKMPGSTRGPPGICSPPDVAQDLVGFALWGFESPLSHQQLSSPHAPREPPEKRLRLAPVSHRVELSPVVPRGRWAAPHQNLTGPSARKIVVVNLCRVARPTWGSILCWDPANRISKVVSERAPFEANRQRTFGSRSDPRKC